MAHFFRPPGEPMEGYTVDRKLAPDSVSTIEVVEGGSKRVGLWGGKELWVKSKHPDIVPNPILVRPLAGDTDVILVVGKKAGTAKIETGQGSNLWVSLDVKVMGTTGPTVLTEDIASRPFPPDFLQRASATFSVGFAKGLAAKLDRDLGTVLSDKILANKLDFYTGYVTGVIRGLIGGLRSLLEILYDVAKLVVTLSMPNLMFAVVKEAALTITSKAHREMREMQIEQAKKTASLIAGIIQEIQAKPMLYISKSEASGTMLGVELAAYINAGAREKSASALGVFVGEIVGRVLFEIIIFIVMAAISGGAGEAGRAGLGLGEVAEGSKTYAGLLKKLMSVLEEMPAIRKLIAELFEAKGLTSAAKTGESAATAALEAELEAAFGEGAVLQRGARGGFPLLDQLPELTPGARQAANRLLGQELGSELRNAWNACSNEQAVMELEEVQRLLKTGSAADREAAYKLSERTYGNWRDRFWRRVRSNDNLRNIFTDAGAVFDGKSGAPYYRLGEEKTKNLTITLDHFIERRVDNPARAVDALNVRPSISFENSATLEAIRRDNFLKGWKRPVDL